MLFLKMYQDTDIFINKLNLCPKLIVLFTVTVKIFMVFNIFFKNLASAKNIELFHYV